MPPCDKLSEHNVSKESKRATYFNVLEKFLRKVAFNLGNTPSRTEVKVISCIPVDVSDLQERINCLAIKLDQEIHANEVLQRRLEGELKTKEYLKRTIDINYSKSQRRHPDPKWSAQKRDKNKDNCIPEDSVDSTVEDTHTIRTYNSEINSAVATKNESLSENSYNVSGTPHKAKSLRHKVSKIISRAHTAMTTRQKLPLKQKKQCTKEESPGAAGSQLLTNDLHGNHKTITHYIGDYNFEGKDKVASCHMDRYYEMNYTAEPIHSGIQTQDSVANSYYDDELYDMVPVKDNANDNLAFNDENTSQKKYSKSKKNLHHRISSNQKAHKSVYFDKLPSFSSCSTDMNNEPLFLKKCQRIYAEMEQMNDFSNTCSGTTGTSYTVSTESTYTEKPDTLLLQIKDILRSLLAEVKTNPALYPGNTPKKGLVELKDAIVQKNLDEYRLETFGNTQDFSHINEQKYAFLHPVACCPFLFPNSPRLPLCVNCLQTKIQDVVGSDTTKGTNKKLSMASCNKISSVTERLVKEIYNTVIMSKDVQNSSSSKNGKKKPSQKSIEESPKQKPLVVSTQSESTEESTYTTSSSRSKDADSEDTTTDVTKDTKLTKSTTKSGKNSAEKQKSLCFSDNEPIEQRQPTPINTNENKITEQKNYHRASYNDSMETISESPSVYSYAEFADKLAEKIKKPVVLPSIVTRIFVAISEKIYNAGNKSKKQSKNNKTLQYLVLPKNLSPK